MVSLTLPVPLAPRYASEENREGPWWGTFPPVEHLKDIPVCPSARNARTDEFGRLVAVVCRTHAPDVRPQELSQAPFGLPFAHPQHDWRTSSSGKSTNFVACG